VQRECGVRRRTELHEPVSEMKRNANPREGGLRAPEEKERSLNLHS